MSGHEAQIVIPGALMQAVAARSGRVTFVLGAGCSLEAPTSLKLSSEYSLAVFRSLVDDGDLEAGDCDDPSDLSCVASAVHAKYASQDRVVSRLPRNAFLYAKANTGYLVAAALLIEGAATCVATLNYDLALTDAVRHLDGVTVSQVAGPSHLADFGDRAIVYLHRNVNEQDFDRWILRREALDDEWREGWETVVGQRIATSPVVVFAGLGSPAAVLTETLGRVRHLVPDATVAFLVDPGAGTEFSEALSLDPANHLQLRWGEFMEKLGARLAKEFAAEFRVACTELIQRYDWDDRDDVVDALTGSFENLGLIGIGRARAAWLLSDRSYEPDAVGDRPLIADVLLAVGRLVDAEAFGLSIGSDGTIAVTTAEDLTITALPASGRGHRRWADLDPVLAIDPTGLRPTPDVVVAGGFQGVRQDHMSPPEDIVSGEAGDDVAVGHSRPRLVTIDDLRAAPPGGIEERV